MSDEDYGQPTELEIQPMEMAMPMMDEMPPMPDMGMGIEMPMDTGDVASVIEHAVEEM